MAILSGDWDIEKRWLDTHIGGNGDFYFQMYRQKKDGTIEPPIAFRFVMSGSRIPQEVRHAAAKLCFLMEEHGLTGHPEDSKPIA